MEAVPRPTEANGQWRIRCERLGLLCGQPCRRHFPLNLTSAEQSDLVSSCLSDSFYNVGIELMLGKMHSH